MGFNFMKLFRIANLVICFAFLQNASGQGFVNLNFEQSIVTSSNYVQGFYFGYYEGTAVVPGWYWNGSGQFHYNLLSTGVDNTTLISGALGGIDGAFSMLLQAFFYMNVSVSQTGAIPVNAESLLFKAQAGTGAMLVSVGGKTFHFMLYRMVQTTPYMVAIYQPLQGMLNS